MRSAREFQLHPLGAVRAALGGTPDTPWPSGVSERLEELDSPPSAAILAWEIARLPGELPAPEREGLFFIALAVVVAGREGNSGLPLPGADFLRDSLVGRLARLGAEGVALEAAIDLARELPVSVPLRLAPAVSGPSGFAPLVVDGSAISTLISREREERVAARLLARLSSTDLFSGGEARAVLSRLNERPVLDKGVPVRPTPEQEKAVLLAISRRLTVVTGGPGTGKTSAAVSILRAMARLGIPPTALALAAPTGKAAARLFESVRHALHGVTNPADEDRDLAESLPPARTLHRLLGFTPSSGTFRYHENNHLSEQVILVDEASMVDLALFDRLLRAAGDEARLVLMGDADQLPSVEAGAVFRDLLPPAGTSSSDPRSAACVRLGKNWRLDASLPSGRSILEAAEAFRAGDAGGARGSIRVRSADLLFEGLESLPDASPSALAEFLDRWYAARFASDPVLAGAARREWSVGTRGPSSRDLPLLFERLESFRLLAVTRGAARSTGAAALASELHRRHAKATFGAREADGPLPRYLPGEPVLVTENDYERNLFNGDQGVVLRVRDGSERRRHRFMAVFRDGDEFAAHPVDALTGRLELGWAVTVHRAQGSEFNVVALVLPADADLPLLTRELLYTTVTRARRSVVLVGSPDVVASAARRRITRFSRLGGELSRRN